MKNIISIICLFITFSAQGNECRTDPTSLSVYYGNGMLSSLLDADQSRSALQKLLRGKLPKLRATYRVAFNQNEEPVDLIQELVRQKSLQDFSQVILWLAGIDEAPAWFQELITDVASQFPKYSYVRDTDLRTHVRYYLDDIERCKKVLLVAHSQGNFYGNEAWQRVYQSSVNSLSLNQLKVMGLVSVATPASYVGTPLFYAQDHPAITRHLTLNNDVVINLLRLLFPIDPLPGNLENYGESVDWSNHKFISSYASGFPSSQMLVEHIQSVAYNLETLPLQRDKITSSALASAGYDSAANILEVEFLRSGSVYRYYGVPKPVFDGLMGAASAGGYYNQVIRGQYTSRKLH